ncbi:AraC family transcriptional regulator [Paenibacillus psychroresistens]|uniref:AraC family transcriptional regulator n=1 Tax=Paenibacillus psychroresistens TaxID=1778678 RepID=A0A6B8RTE2_9BACL|nr:AraC family transcriptional regulator [Paenibacillus psychroresistens]QGQ99064.1 AraC family transcriptional regulator [Paenibacillus psychroresistens]
MQEFEAGGIHPYHELLYIQTGKVQLTWLHQTYEVSAPALFILSANTPHRMVQKSVQYAYYYLELESAEESLFPAIAEARIWNALQGNLEMTSAVVRLIIDSAELLGSLIKQKQAFPVKAFETIASHDINKIIILIKHLLQTMVNPNSQQMLADEKHSFKQAIIETLMRYMETFYLEDVTLKTLVDQVHLNPSYLIRLFREVHDMTPFQYLNTLRMNAAVSYLQESKLTIQEISSLSGYGSIHYFSRLFKKKYGISPSLWREKN